MNIRPDAWRRALRSPQVIISVLTLIAALVAVMVTRPDPVTAEPFELPVIEPRPVQQEEVRIITYDRFNLQVPLRQTLEVPGDAAGRAEAITRAVMERFQEGSDEAWPAELDMPVVFVLEQDDGLTAVVDFQTGEGTEVAEAARDRIRRSLSQTLTEAGMDSVVMLWNGERLLQQPAPETEDPD